MAHLFQVALDWVVYARHGRNREILSGGSIRQSYKPEPVPNLIRETETAYKAESVGELAQHNKALGSAEEPVPALSRE